jgi:hypothetical protein
VLPESLDGFGARGRGDVGLQRETVAAARGSPCGIAAGAEQHFQSVTNAFPRGNAVHWANAFEPLFLSETAADS